jgi:glutathione synthase/RimK-type ligase-like ATP-grasp enzyme
VIVCAGEVVAAMTRRADDWITNIRRGGTPEPLVPDAELVALSFSAAEAVGAVYAGVDLLRGADGRALVIEVNSMPGWRGLQTVTERPIASAVAGALLRTL